MNTQVERREIHARRTSYRAYLRADGLWDIEGELVDTKPYLFVGYGKVEIPAGEIVHGMKIRVTVDEQSMAVREIATTMTHTPFPECAQAKEAMGRVVGLTMARGWRQAIEATLGGIQSCAHLRDLLVNMATAAYQAIVPHQEHQMRLGELPPRPGSGLPPYAGSCIAWTLDGAVVARYCPDFKRGGQGPG